MASPAEHSSAAPQDVETDQQHNNSAVLDSVQHDEELPPFEPVFALLTNNTTNSTIHPRVHYVFSDDDATPLDAESADDPSHRPIVVDLVPNEANDGWKVSWASSLSPDFAVVATELSKQQQGSADGEADASTGTLMLRIDGVTREPVDTRFDPDNSQPNSGSASGAIGKDEAESLADEFRRRLAGMKTVVDAGQQRRLAALEQTGAYAPEDTTEAHNFLVDNTEFEPRETDV
ncbi:hypothetical protein VHEMI04848 [[Torrubiella] hemipterigena]|uniref:Uncharacterized protein n=1 Tax=[Torrubiella] hemipterigena TaxID=1531966 RepID=A0A0A1T2E1_9HYPO|nr:hypothetical protein VHEMI04848 [[Torrubiella] hemipterigena]